MANNRRLFADEYIKTVSGAGEIFNIPEIETGEKPPFRFYSLDNVFLLGPGIVIGKDSIIVKDSVTRTSISTLFSPACPKELTTLISRTGRLRENSFRS